MDKKHWHVFGWCNPLNRFHWMKLVSSRLSLDICYFSSRKLSCFVTFLKLLWWCNMWDTMCQSLPSSQKPLRCVCLCVFCCHLTLWTPGCHLERRNLHPLSIPACFIQVCLSPSVQKSMTHHWQISFFIMKKKNHLLTSSKSGTQFWNKLVFVVCLKVLLKYFIPCWNAAKMG